MNVLYTYIFKMVYFSSNIGVKNREKSILHLVHRDV